MTFYVENETDESFEFDVEELIKKLTAAVTGKFGVSHEVSLNVTFTDDETIKDINAQFRNLDRSTDVLSFPALNFEKPGDFSSFRESDPECFDPDTGELILGDIMISLDHAHKQAEEYGHSYLREIAFLITHSLLHLSGFDHETDGDRLEMESIQEEILGKVGITREMG